ncbi:MAG: LPS-assembly protein LptD [Nitrospinae bacterium]|nr:LPS-assembly protein LptD [Nitrospinota bacterium]
MNSTILKLIRFGQIAAMLAISVAGIAYAQPAPPAGAPAASAPSAPPVSITAGQIYKDSQSGETAAYDNAQVSYGDKTLSGDVIFYNPDTGDGRVEGSAVYQDPKSRLEAERADFNTITGLGTLYRASGKFDNLYNLRGAKIQRVEEDRYVAREAGLTTCKCEDPQWEIESSYADVTVDGYAHLTNPVFHAAGVPVFYLPYLPVPVKNKRATGFLMPAPAYSDNLGFQVENKFFWAIADNMDATLTHHYLGEAGNKYGAEYRYIFRDFSGQFNGEYIQETDPDQPTDRNLWRVLFDHRHNLPWNIRNVFHINKESEESISRQYSESLTDRSRNYNDSYVTFSRSWPTRTVTLMAREQIALDPSNAQTLRKTPELRLINQKESIKGTPLYWSLESSYTGFRTENGLDEYRTTFDVERADFYPSISMPISISPFLSLEAAAWYRATWYSRGQDTSGNPVDESFTRQYYQTSFTVTGPKFFRIFETGTPERPALKHVITPKLVWNYIPGYEMDGENRQNVYVIDTVDSAPPTNAVALQIANDLLAKDVLSPESSRTVSLARFVATQPFDIIESNRTESPETEKRPLAPLQLEFRSRPADWLLFNYSTTYNHYDKFWETSTLEAGLKLWDVANIALDRIYKWGGKDGQDSTWDTAYLEVKLPWNLSLDFSWVYDEANAKTTNSLVRARFREDCWGLAINLDQRQLTKTAADGSSYTEDERRIMFTITLLGIGDILGGEQPAYARKKL